MTEFCRSIAPLLQRVADGEAAPQEAMQSARHLSDCTHCRIVLAREQRLASMLEDGLDDPLHVGEDFVRNVMANLPQGPPPAPRVRKTKRRNLKLAGFVGLLALSPLALTASGAASSSRAAWLLVPNLHVPSADGLADGALRLGGLLMVVIGRLAAGLPIPGVSLGGLLTVLTFASVGLCVGLAAVAAMMVGMRILLQTSR